MIAVECLATVEIITNASKRQICLPGFQDEN